jgi:tetratricopeptide (TPR) repeat protein
MRKLLMSKIKEYPHHYRHQQYVREGDAERVENLVRLVWQLTGEEQHTATTLVPIVNSLRSQKKMLSLDASAEQTGKIERELLRYEEQLVESKPVSSEDFYALGLVQAESFKYQESLELFRKARELATEKLASGDEVFGEVLAAGLREIEAARRLHKFELAVSRHAALEAVYEFAKRNYGIDHKFAVSRLGFAEGYTIVERLFSEPNLTEDKKKYYFQSAIEIFNQILALEPNNSRFLVGASLLYQKKLFFEVVRDDMDQAEKELDQSFELTSKALALNPQDPRAYFNRLFLNAVKGDWDELNSDVRLGCYWFRFNDNSGFSNLNNISFESLFSNEWKGAMDLNLSMRSEFVRDIGIGFAQFINFHPDSEHYNEAVERCMIALESSVALARIYDTSALLNIGLDSEIFTPVKKRFPERFQALEGLTTTIISKEPLVTDN